MSISKSDSYAAAGVDVTAGYESTNLIKPMVESHLYPRRNRHFGRLWRLLRAARRLQ